MGSSDDTLNAVRRESAEARQFGQMVHRQSLDIERLLMITEALWTIVKEELKLSDDQLQRRLIEIDMRDGKYDGQVSGKAPPKSCSRCHRPISKRRTVCMYCGKQLLPDPFTR